MEFNLPAGKHATTFPRLCPVTSGRSQALRTPPTLSPKPPRSPLSLTHASVSSSVRGGRARDQLSPQKRASHCAGRWCKPLVASPQKTPLSPAPSSAHSPSPHLGPSPRTPSRSLLSLHPPGLTSHTVEPGDSPAMWQVDWGQEGWQRQARLGVSHSHASACLGFCICKMGTVALAPSCLCPRGARRPLALPRLCYWHRHR